jgi:hypothetical protein
LNPLISIAGGALWVTAESKLQRAVARRKAHSARVNISGWDAVFMKVLVSFL